MKAYGRRRASQFQKYAAYQTSFLLNAKSNAGRRGYRSSSRRILCKQARADGKREIERQIEEDAT